MMDTAKSNPYGDDISTDPYEYDYQPFKKPPIPTSARSASGGIGMIGGDGADDESMRLKAQELARREAELDRREAELQVFSGADGGDGTVMMPMGPKKNFPICYPVVYHSIIDIKDRYRKIICLMGLYAWISLYILTALNFIIGMITIFTPRDNPIDDIKALEKAQYAIFAFAFAIIAPNVHFLLSYWPLYQAMRTVNLGRFVIFFVAYPCPILYCAFCVAGWYPYGATGIVSMLTTLNDIDSKVWLFLLNLFMAILWALQCLVYIIIYVNALIIFRTQNGTIRKGAEKVKELAQSQLARGVKSGVTSAVNTAMSRTGGQV